MTSSLITIPVDVPGHAYEVVVGDGAHRELPRLVAEVGSSAPASASASVSASVSDSGAGAGAVRQVAVITEPGLVDRPWFDDLDPGVAHQIHTIAGGEDGKNLGTVTALCEALASQGLSRRDLVVAVGGGVVSDLAGFVASTYLRGIAYINVATTLLAQVDAAIGGKTGANLPQGKNLVGTFWQPRAVLCDTGLLATLPRREWACGRGEMAKYAFLTGRQPDTSWLDLPLAEQVARCVTLKAEVVATDEREGGRRALLNYGHTLAHAIEALQLEQATAAVPEPGAGSGPHRAEDDWRVVQDLDPVGLRRDAALRHGEAVAVGLMFAARLAQRLGRIDQARVQLHQEVLGAFALSGELPEGLPPTALLSFMERDKKAHHDLTFVLDGPRGPEVVPSVPVPEVLATLAAMSTDPRGSGTR